MDLFGEFFRDPRYRNERILMVVAAPIVLLLIGGLAYLLIVVDNRKPAEVRILTADQVVEPVVAAEEVSPLNKGLELVKNQQFEEAKEVFASVQGKDRAAALRNLAFLERREGNHQEAIGILDESISLEPTALGYFLRGDSYRALGDMPAARKDLEEAAALNPSEPVFTNALLLLRIEMGEIQQVEEKLQLRASLGLGGTVTSWVLAAAVISLEKGQTSDAAMFMTDAFNSLMEEDFDLLLTYKAVQKFQDNPAILPFYIKTSTVRQRSQ